MLVACIFFVSMVMLVYSWCFDAKFLLVVLVAFGSHFMFGLTALLNPGIASRNFPPDDWKIRKEKKKYCKVCRVIKDKWITHCDDCNVCIKNLDHHCPVTGKCIGRGNILCFYAMIMWFYFAIFFCLLIVF